MQHIFQDHRVYRGGNTAQQVFMCLHPHGWLDGSVEVVPGVHVGGVGAAIKAVHSGKLDPKAFKFFSG